MEAFQYKVNEIADLSKFKLDLGGSYAFMYLNKQSLSGEQPRARGPFCLLILATRVKKTSPESTGSWQEETFGVSYQVELKPASLATETS